MSNRTKLILASMVTLVPGVAVAANDIPSMVTSITTAITPIPKLLLALAFIYFIYGVFTFAMNASDEKKRTEARTVIIYGLIFMVIMVSTWGLVELVTSTLGIGAGTAPAAPKLPGSTL